MRRQENCSPPHLSTLRGTGPNPTKGRLRGVARQAPLQDRSPLLVWRTPRSHPISGMRAPVPHPLPRTPRDRGPSPTNACGTATAIPMETAPVSVSGSYGWHRSTNLGKKRNTPQPHLRAPKPGCRLATAQQSCCYEQAPMDKPHSLPTLENVISVAKRLGIGRSTLYARVKKGLSRHQSKSGGAAVG